MDTESSITFVAAGYEDIAFNILRWIGDGSTYKAATRVCQLWHTICREKFRWMIAKYSNHLWTLIDMQLPETMSCHKFAEAYSWVNLSKNPNTTWDLIKSHPGIGWNWYYISSNPNITW